jgi:hypothetical protein
MFFLCKISMSVYRTKVCDTLVHHRLNDLNPDRTELLSSSVVFWRSEVVIFCYLLLYSEEVKWWSTYANQCITAAFCSRVYAPWLCTCFKTCSSFWPRPFGHALHECFRLLSYSTFRHAALHCMFILKKPMSHISVISKHSCYPFLTEKSPNYGAYSSFYLFPTYNMN